MSPVCIAVKKNDSVIGLSARISNAESYLINARDVTISEFSPANKIVPANLTKGVDVQKYRCVKTFNGKYRLTRIACGDKYETISNELDRLIDCQIQAILDYCNLNSLEQLYIINEK